jgi:hypothetical protein
MQQHISTHQFYHATLNYLVISTLVKAIDEGYLNGFPGLTSCHVHQHIKVNDEMEKGHMDQFWQGKRSTKNTLNFIL